MGPVPGFGFQGRKILRLAAVPDRGRGEWLVHGGRLALEPRVGGQDMEVIEAEPSPRKLSLRLLLQLRHAFSEGRSRCGEEEGRWGKAVDDWWTLGRALWCSCNTPEKIKGFVGFVTSL